MVWPQRMTSLYIYLYLDGLMFSQHANNDECLKFKEAECILFYVVTNLWCGHRVSQWDPPRRRQAGPDGDGHDVVGDALCVV